MNQPMNICSRPLPSAFSHRLLRFPAALVFLLAWMLPAVSSRGADHSNVPGEDLFADGQITRLELEISTNDLPQIRDQKLSFQRARPSYAITVREGDRTYRHVSMHLKGSFGSFRNIDSKPSITLNFGEASDPQHFHGLKKISLNNSVQDPTYISEKFTRELFRKVGVPCPRVGYATVTVNGRDMGLYLLVESYGRQFLKQHFEDTSGNLYDIAPGEELDLSGKHPVNSGDQPTEQGELRALVEAINQSDPGERMRQMRRTLDLDRFVKHLALDVLIHNWDGYGWGVNNYRIFNDRANSRLVFMPHGLDQTFQLPEASITPRMGGAVARAILGTSEGLQIYLRELAFVVAKTSPARDLTNRVRTLVALIRPELARRSGQEASKFDEDVSSYCEHIEKRVAFVRSQLDEASQPVKFNERGELAVTGFTSWNEFGQPTLAREAANEHLLRIASTNGPAIAWWSRKVWLPQGRYQFEGKIRGNGIVALPDDLFGGAGLRIAGYRLANGLKGTSPWINLLCNFEITDALFPVQLICELRGASGEVVFDEDSLRITSR